MMMTIIVLISIIILIIMIMIMIIIFHDIEIITPWYIMGWHPAGNSHVSLVVRVLQSWLAIFLEIVS